MAQDHKLRVLQINASTKGYGGVSAILFNIYKHIDRSVLHLIFSLRTRQRMKFAGTRSKLWADICTDLEYTGISC